MGTVAAVLVGAAPAVMLADGVDPEDASPGLGAFLTFLILALVIIGLAWSFTRHQRKIRARERLEVEREEALAAQEDGAQSETTSEPRGAVDAPGQPGSGDELAAPEAPDAPSEPDLPGESDQNGTHQP